MVVVTAAHIQGLGFRVQDLGFRVQGLAVMVQWLWVQGLGFRVQGVVVMGQVFGALATLAFPVAVLFRAVVGSRLRVFPVRINLPIISCCGGQQITNVSRPDKSPFYFTQWIAPSQKYKVDLVKYPLVRAHLKTQTQRTKLLLFILIRNKQYIFENASLLTRAMVWRVSVDRVFLQQQYYYGNFLQQQYYY